MPRYTQRITERHGEVELTIDVAATGPADQAVKVHRVIVEHVADPCARPRGLDCLFGQDRSDVTVVED